MAETRSLREPARDLGLLADVDVCVLGGSCTGVFAAIRAARLGCRVALIERAGALGGVATLSLVNVWHSLLDTAFERPIIAGLTTETIDRLRRRDAVRERCRSHSVGFTFNPFELQIELDEMVAESKTIDLHLHTHFSAPLVEDGALVGVAVENKCGRQAIRAGAFIDATGDGDLCARLGLETYRSAHLQPSTTCATFSGWESLGKIDLNVLLNAHRDEERLPEGFAWGADLPGSSIHMLAATRVYQADCSDGRALTGAEVEGRRQVRAIMDIVRRHVPDQQLALQSLPARIGIRETRHVRCRRQLSGAEVLGGRRFDDAIANGSYRVDIHHQEKPGITFRYLDGVEQYARPGYPMVQGRWRDPVEVDPTFYQIPYSAMVPAGAFGNVICAGRMIDADSQAHAAIRVMVNMNQTGEAAGVAAWHSLDESKPFGDLDAGVVRRTLAAGGSIII